MHTKNTIYSIENFHNYKIKRIDDNTKSGLEDNQGGGL